jgi:hypothetical protein
LESYLLSRARAKNDLKRSYAHRGVSFFAGRLIKFSRQKTKRAIGVLPIARKYFLNNVARLGCLQLNYILEMNRAIGSAPASIFPLERLKC